MRTIKGPRFRSVKINPHRNLTFDLDRQLAFRTKGVIFRKKGVAFRKQGVRYKNKGVSNIKIKRSEDPRNLNNIGVKHYNKGNYKTALKYFDKALSVAPQFDLARKNRSYCIKMIAQQHEQELETEFNKNYIR